MIPKFRAWMKSLKWMCEVTVIDYDLQSLDICRIGDVERYTEMSVDKDEVVLMQSTGIKDKNGVEIFEGDVVSFKNTIVSNGDQLGIVKYFTKWAMYGMDVKKFNYPSALFLNELADHISLEVIGNIYENPEFTEVGHDIE